jgi:hypothetical protein
LSKLLLQIIPRSIPSILAAIVHGGYSGLNSGFYRRPTAVTTLTHRPFFPFFRACGRAARAHRPFSRAFRWVPELFRPHCTKGVISRFPTATVHAAAPQILAALIPLFSPGVVPPARDRDFVAILEFFRRGDNLCRGAGRDREVGAGTCGSLAMRIFRIILGS